MANKPAAGISCLLMESGVDVAELEHPKMVWWIGGATEAAGRPSFQGIYSCHVFYQLQLQRNQGERFGRCVAALPG